MTTKTKNTHNSQKLVILFVCGMLFLSDILFRTVHFPQVLNTYEYSTVNLLFIFFV